MVGWIVGKLKWLLLVCAVGGPILALSCWYDGNRRRDVMANGVQATASIESATRVKRRRGGTSYKLDLVWSDAGGLRRRAEEVSISHGLARQIVVDDRLVVGDLPIKYMPVGTTSSDRVDPSENLILLDDTAHQEQTDREMVYLGSGAGVVGLLGAALMFLPWRRRREPVPATT